MIYIITPHREDYKRMCHQYDLPYMNGNGVGGIYWINSPEQLFGRKIFPNDQIIRGEDYCCFPTKVIDRIEVELKIRMGKECE